MVVSHALWVDMFEVTKSPVQKSSLAKVRTGLVEKWYAKQIW